MVLEKIRISSGGEFIDSQNRVVQLRGVNFDPCIKYPNSPPVTSHSPLSDSFWNLAEDANFVNHPININEVEEHITRLKSMGYNTIRFCFNWEALEHKGPGQYDFEYIEYVRQVLLKIYELGDIYIYFDPHQDVWSRFTGGSGAPLWTLHAAGFQPKRLSVTQAAILHNDYIDEDSGEQVKHYPKMIWPTNYFKLACQTMFTLFFGGRKYAPKCIVNDVNIQDYLQDSFNKAIAVMYQYLMEKSPELFEGNLVLGLETVNEPNEGYIGYPILSQIPKERELRMGPTPTAFQSFILGEGFETSVDLYDITVGGPKKIGTTLVNPKGESAWMSKDERDEMDAKYGWKRADSWESGCIWKLHGVWGIKEMKPRLLHPRYFSDTGVDLKYFIDNMYVSYFEKARTMFRSIDKDRFIFMQNPVFQPPPAIKNSTLIDDKTVFATHFYDGMSLMFKTWNKIYNVNTLGIVRGRYINPVFSVVVGENNIKKCIAKQLRDIRDEAREMLGDHIAIIFSEIGMPFDMDNKEAYKTGEYTSQTSAMDAIGFALENSNLSFSLWCYCTKNSHQWGDQWNNEDFSLWSPDDVQRAKVTVQVPQIGNEAISLQESEMFSSESALTESTKSTPKLQSANDMITIDYSGFRALESVLRPSPIKISGTFISAKFDPFNSIYDLEIHGHPSNTNQTLIFLPAYHFKLDSIIMKSSSGHFFYDPNRQILQWLHEPGRQFLNISKIAVSANEDSCVIT
ncbi:unnamed protein product [Kluyveromyces dobzhanskii CBS 2104]|uniref:WGS project CCBQ000000000 data, contig 00012 n=1 Tax=Kluyveromyces dobzhanskii CBS 2104 TaxID=1427455 RepID=A0A0A8L0X9_9SACH|nr:unnamed protein product [Kluyveromyces dobzhanskii CBS 2104]